MKTLIRCKNCAILGQTRTLAEILPDGNIAVKRFVDRYNAADQTIIMGSDFTVYCGSCGKPMYQKKQAMQIAVMQGTTMTTDGTLGTSFV